LDDDAEQNKRNHAPDTMIPVSSFFILEFAPALP